MQHCPEATHVSRPNDPNSASPPPHPAASTASSVANNAAASSLSPPDSVAGNAYSSNTL